MSGPNKSTASPRAHARPQGRELFAGLAVMSAGLLMLIGSQTEPGFQGGSWWNEPINGPLFSLGLLFLFSVLASVFADRDKLAQVTVGYLSIVVAIAFVGSIWMMRHLGYGLSVVIFSTICGMIAGFRGRKLLWSVLGFSIVMVVIFRHILGIWFARATLFELAPWLETLGRYL